MAIINTILEMRRDQNPNRPSTLRTPLRRIILGVDELLFDLENNVVPDDYCFEQLAELERRLARVKELMTP